MRTFKKFSQSDGDVCPICGTDDDKETVLIGIVGTEDGGNIQAKQFHLECINLLYYPKEKLIAQVVSPTANAQ